MRPALVPLLLTAALALLPGATLAEDAPSLRRTATAPPPADPDAFRQPETVLVLEARDPSPLAAPRDGGAPKPSGGGGMVGALNRVTDAMASAGAGGGASGAGSSVADDAVRVRILLTPDYERIAEGLYKVPLAAGEPDVALGARVRPEFEREARNDLARVLARLKSFDRTLTDAETRALFGYDAKVRIALEDNFEKAPTEGLRVLRAAAASLELRLRPVRGPRPSIEFLVRDESGGETRLSSIPPGTAFFIEAKYSASAPKEGPRTLALAWEGGGRDVVMSPVEGRFGLYRAGPFYVPVTAEAANGNGGRE
ncbi:MAG: hypothetical protein H6923_05635 [Alphaproteobacteria bacterium]|nr:hypothetical protein [Alphaproteobacteria bacterium]